MLLFLNRFYVENISPDMSAADREIDAANLENDFNQTMTAIFLQGFEAGDQHGRTLAKREVLFEALAGEAGITPVIANQVLYYFGEGGYPAGSFTHRLYDTFGHADTQNFERLRQAFPAEAAAMHLVMNDRSGITRLRQIAQGDAK